MVENINLSTIWEWDPISGNPVIPADVSPNARHCPTIAEMEYLVHSRIVVPDDLKRDLRRFMMSNEMQMTMKFNVQKASAIMSYLRMIRCLDFKKIQLEYFMGGTLLISKLPRETPFNDQPYGTASNMHLGKNGSMYLIVQDININALLGWVGPGTFPCCDPRCHLCPFTGRSPTVDLGPQGQLALTKRAYCGTCNAVYVGTCRQCQEEGSFTCYFGESGTPLHQRWTCHRTNACNSSSVLKDKDRFPNVQFQRAEISRVLATGDDQEEVLRDWFAHVTEGGVHPGHQQISVVDIIPHSFPRKNRERNLVEQHMYQNGDFLYLGMGTGCLNTYTF